MDCKTCVACPCALTDASEEIQELGCLPTPGMIKDYNKEGYLWACHESEFKRCAGQYDSIFSEISETPKE